MADSGGRAAAAEPPTTHRRPRVREVSSRFMSPLIQSNSTATPIPTDSSRSKSVQRRPPSKIDEEPRRSFDKSSTPALALAQSTILRKRVKQYTKENEEPKDHHSSDPRVLSRPDTPISICADRIVASRYRQVPNTLRRSKSTNSSINGGNTVTAAARLLQDATSENKVSRIFSTSSRDDISVSGQSNSSDERSSSCPNSPLCVAGSKLRVVSDARSSMPDVDKWLVDRNWNNTGKKTNDCSRSLNFQSSLPPHPSLLVRSGLDLKKGSKKVSNHQEDVHSLKMLNNHHLQFRLANAKAEAAINAQKQQAEREIYSIAVKISDIRDNVKRKRRELAVLRGMKNLSMIVEPQMPYLDEWDILEDDYSTSLSGLTNALLNCSVRLPVSGEVRADAGELREALSAALKVVDMIGSNIQTLMSNAEEIDASASELAKVAGGERALIEECGDLLSKTHVSQVKEFTKRTTLMQISSSSNNQNQIQSENTSD